jgi:hypothetical protein
MSRQFYYLSLSELTSHPDAADLSIATQTGKGVNVTSAAQVNIVSQNGNDITLTSSGKITLNPTHILELPEAKAISTIDMDSNIITNLPLPTNGGDATSKAYVDSRAAGVHPGASCQVANVVALPSYTYTSAGALGVGDTISAASVGVLPPVGALGPIDGQNDIIVGSRVLHMFPDADLANGIYVVTDLGSATTPWSMVRAVDSDTSAKLAGEFTLIIEGDVNAGATFICTNTLPFVVGTDPISYTTFTAPIVALGPDGGLEYDNSGELEIKLDGDTLLTSIDGLKLNTAKSLTGSDELSGDVTLSGPILTLGDVVTTTELSQISSDVLKIALASNDTSDHSLAISATNSSTGTGNLALSADDEVSFMFNTLAMKANTQDNAESQTTTTITEVTTLNGSNIVTVATFDAPTDASIFNLNCVVVGSDPANPSTDSASFVVTEAFTTDGTSVSEYATTGQITSGWVSSTTYWWTSGASVNLVPVGNTVEVQVSAKTTSTGTYKWRATTEVNTMVY